MAASSATAFGASIARAITPVGSPAFLAIKSNSSSSLSVSLMFSSSSTNVGSNADQFSAYFLAHAYSCPLAPTAMTRDLCGCDVSCAIPLASGPPCRMRTSSPVRLLHMCSSCGDPPDAATTYSPSWLKHAAAHCDLLTGLCSDGDVVNTCVDVSFTFSTSSRTS